MVFGGQLIGGVDHIVQCCRRGEDHGGVSCDRSIGKRSCGEVAGFVTDILGVTDVHRWPDLAARMAQIRRAGLILEPP